MSEKISVIVSTYTQERSDDVLKCISSLKVQTILPDEIILVLDPKNDLINFYKKIVPEDVKIVISDGFGLSEARNAGIKNSTGDLIFFIDDDAFAEKDWLENMVTVFRNPDVKSVGGLIRPVWNLGKPFWFPDELLWTIGCCYKGLPEEKSKIRNAIGCNMGFRSDVFNRIGFFKENIGRFGKTLLAGEEAEISMRIIKQYTEDSIIYDPLSIVYHRVPESRTKLSYVLRRSFYEGVSKSIISKTCGNTGLSTENSYLKYLLTKAIPKKLKYFYDPKNIVQLFVLVMSSGAVGIGYFIGKFTK